MPRPGPRKSQMPIRMSTEEIAAVEVVAGREGTNRSGAARLLMSYAIPRMPEGWRPTQDDSTQITDQEES
jgi:hypothetical protein